MNQRIRRGACVVALFATAITTVNVLGAGTAAAGTYNISFSIANPGPGGVANIDAWYGGCGGNSPNGSGYDGSYDWNSAGAFSSNGFGSGLSPTQVPNPGLGCGSSQLSLVRLELYTGGIWNDEWVGNYGGAHAQLTGAGFNFGAVPLPTVGIDGAFRIEGDIVSSTPVPNDRVNVDLFQIGCIPPDVCVPLKVTNTGAQVGGFSSAKNKANRWTGNVGWPGHYLAFVEDFQTGRKAHGYMELAPGQVHTIDLDAPCFGMLTCVYMTGAPGAANGAVNPVGGFHALAPTRILDTRSNVGITGVMMPGDGRSTAGNGYVRRATMLNHELKVTGVAGIPTAGVSAVLLNVTAIASSSPGFLTAFPRPPAVGDIFADQATFGAIPGTSNLNFALGEITPNLVLVKVGAGGTIRFNYSGFAGMHVLADVAGWFDTGASPMATGGLGFTGIAPVRFMDTRNGIGDTIGRFHPGDNRALLVAGTRGIPANAKSVVVNITAAYVPNGGYVTAYPDGENLPNASNLNVFAGGTRANLAVVKVGTNGKIRLAAFESDMDLIVDVFGYYSASGGLTTITDPTRVFDTRNGLHTTIGQLGPGETRNVQIGGLGGIPSGAKAVIVNITVTDPSAGGWLTVWPAGQARPTSSNLNWFPGRTVPNMAILAVGAGGQLSIYNDSGHAGVIVDVFGYVL